MRAPVATTSAVAVPETTLVPMKSRLFCSSVAWWVAVLAWATFSTGSDSPVMADCATNRLRELSTRQSAATMSPADSATTSPGTSVRMGTSLAWPWRITVAVLLTMALRLSAVRRERPSCTKRMPVLKATITAITVVPLASPVVKDTAASAVSSRLKGFL